MFDTFFLIPVLVLIVAVGEMIMSLAWTPSYYHFGIPLFSTTIRISNELDFASYIPELEQKLKRSWWRPDIVLKQLAPDEFAFRHKWSSRNPVCGLIRIDTLTGKLSLTGHLYWSLLVILVVISIIAFTEGFLAFAIPIFLLVGGLNFLIQRNSYTQIAKIIETAVADKDTYHHLYE